LSDHLYKALREEAARSGQAATEIARQAIQELLRKRRKEGRPRECISLKPAIPIEQAASLIVNPLMAMALVDTARRERHRGGHLPVIQAHRKCTDKPDRSFFQRLQDRIEYSVFTISNQR
jgi:hypothetical protein